MRRLPVVLGMVSVFRTITYSGLPVLSLSGREAFPANKSNEWENNENLFFQVSGDSDLEISEYFYAGWGWGATVNRPK